MASEQIQLQISLDNGQVVDGFLQIQNQAKKTADNLEKSFGAKGGALDKFADKANSISSAIAGGPQSIASSLLAMIGPAGAAALAVGTVAVATGKLALAGEETNAVNAQFTNLANSAGLAAENFKNSIIAATQGLIDDEDALQITNKAIVALGESISNLPEIINQSRIVSKALGKDFKETFSNLSSFVETGNTKLLRQYGIVLDVESAYKKQAKAVGLLSEQLTENQKQTIRSNLLLEELPKKFNATTESVTPLKDAFDRLKVSAGNAFESITTTIAEGVTRSFIDEADKSNVATSRLTIQLNEANKSLASMQARIDEIKLDKFGSRSVQAAAEIESLGRSINKTKEEASNLMIELSARSDQELFSALDASKAKDSANKIKLTAEQLKAIADARVKRESELTKFLSEQNITRLQSDLQQVNSKDIINQQITSAQLLTDQKLEILAIQSSQKLKDIQNQFSQEKGFSLDQRLKAELAAISAAEAEKRKIISEGNSLELAAQEKQNEEIKAKKQQQIDSVNSIFKSGLTNLAVTVGENLEKGEALFDDFGSSVQAIFGDMLIAIGQSLLITGPAIEFFVNAINSLVPGSGFAAAAAGLGLIIFGSALKSAVGKGGSKVPSSGGGVASSPGTSTEITPEQNLTRQEPQTTVSVVINGDVLDSEESGSRIITLINDAFSKKGVVIQQGVMA